MVESRKYHSQDTSPARSLQLYLLGKKYLLTVPFLTSNLLQAAAEREPDDEFSVGLSVFYGVHVRATKLCLSVPVKEELNVKQLGMQARLLKIVVFTGGCK